MCSLGEALGEDHIKKEEVRLCRGQGVRTLKEEHRITKGDRG